MRDTERRLAGDVLAEALTGRLDPDELRDAAAPVRGRRHAPRCSSSSSTTRRAAEPLLDRFMARGRRRARSSPRASGHALRGGRRRRRRSRRARRKRARERWPRSTARYAPLPAGRRRRAPLRRSFHEARCALEASALAERRRARGGLATATSAPSSCCSRSRTTRRCASTATACSGPLENGEGEYGDELLRSLEAFIEQNGQWERAARELYCHRHTLRYRIRRVEELTGRDLSTRARPDRVLARAAGEGAGRVSKALTVAVLGAGGTIAPAIVRDLAESEEVDALRLLDLDGERAPSVAAQHGAGQGERRRASTPATASRAALDGLRRAGQLRQLPGQPRRDARLPRGRVPLPRPRRALLDDRRQLELHERVRARAGLLAAARAWARARARPT